MKSQSESDLRDRLAARIGDLRKRRGWTQQVLASRSNMPRSYIADIEGGRRNPSLRSLLRVANALGVEVRELFDAEPQ